MPSGSERRPNWGRATYSRWVARFSRWRGDPVPRARSTDDGTHELCGGSLTVLRSGSASDVGRVRTVNEDLALESLTLFAVADGMGGHVGGEIAARTAIETLQAEFARKPSAEGLAAAIHDAHTAVWERAHEDADLRGMGTTLIAAALVATDDGDRLVLANVGDSRAYRLHGHDLVQLTTDHSVAEELVARGGLSGGGG